MCHFIVIKKYLIFLHLTMTKQCLGFWVIKGNIIGPLGYKTRVQLRHRWPDRNEKERNTKENTNRGEDNTLKINAGEIQSQ